MIWIEIKFEEFDELKFICLVIMLGCLIVYFEFDLIICGL